jgi:hypothetical protein
MKNIKVLFSLLFLIPMFSVAQTSIYKNAKPFAVIKGKQIEIKKDTTLFKKYLKENLFTEADKAIVFDKIEIRKQIMLGSKEVYYCVLITDFTDHMRIAKWLKKKKNNLYLVNDEDANAETIELIYQICIGPENCLPNVFKLDSEKHWTCGETMYCLTEQAAKLNTCKSKKAIITSE